ncbi:MAG: CoA-binding protein [Candidatus Diapherotrites archaeon]|jgi:uncharacterized protein|uniref:CoA-binding protein n=1 Tax=Candidatus Iainarchaeum sp. TaxID=3101447 RepID=A0A8T5GFR8_9ARCH|nr:CoA-binding protein [Candidatus Diapherotrites archaeon]MBT7241314.1 CoA-binding protein [Candidatus Diapherotrites archaeon]
MYKNLVEEILKETKTIAIVGCSSNEEKAAHIVPKYLQEVGYKIIPINPVAEKILGEKVFPSLLKLEEKVDLVLVFRPSEETPIIAKQVINKTKYLWLQLGISNEEVEKVAKEANIGLIMDKCMMVEHKQARQ